jgi:hypothetical protein
MHVAIVPILLGRGERLFDHLDGVPQGYGCTELVSSPSVAHVRLRSLGAPPTGDEHPRPGPASQRARIV